MDLISTTFDCSKYGASKSHDLYVRYFIAFDVRSVHILRIQENINDDYEEDEGSVLIEHEMVNYFPDIIRYFEEHYDIGEYMGDDRIFIDKMIATLGIEKVLKAIVDYDEENGYENYDCKS